MKKYKVKKLDFSIGDEVELGDDIIILAMTDKDITYLDLVTDDFYYNGRLVSELERIELIEALDVVTKTKGNYSHIYDKDELIGKLKLYVNSTSPFLSNQNPGSLVERNISDLP